MPEFLPFVRRWFESTFSEATPPQRDGWEAIASGRDTLIVAPTGSGKTLASFLWALDHLHRLGAEGRLEDRVYVIYVSPLRALNNDIEKNLREPLAGIRAAAEADGLDLPEVRVAVRTGDTLAAQRQAMTRRPPHILITTPESLYILLTTAGFRGALARARVVIVDEVHALLGGKRGAHLALSLERLQALVEDAGEPRPQRIGCSATVRPVEEALAFLTGATARDALIVDAGFSRDLDVAVVTPVDDFLTATSDTVHQVSNLSDLIWRVGAESLIDRLFVLVDDRGGVPPFSVVGNGRDGMPAETLELAAFERLGIRLLGSWRWARVASGLGLTRLLPYRARAIYRRSAAIALLSVQGDQREDFVRGGQVLERLWLTATRHDVAFQPITGTTFLLLRRRLVGGEGLNARHRRLLDRLDGELKQVFPECATDSPIMLFRLGLASPPSGRAPRLPLERVLDVASTAPARPPHPGGGISE